MRENRIRYFGKRILGIFLLSFLLIGIVSKDVQAMVLPEDDLVVLEEEQEEESYEAGFVVSNQVIESAISWGKSQQGSQNYTGYCQAFVWACFNEGGFPGNSSVSYASAKACKDTLMISSDINAPRGSVVFFNVTQGAGAPYGHIGISLGDGTMIHAGHNGVEITNFTDASYLSSWYWLEYCGWGVWGNAKGNTLESMSGEVNFSFSELTTNSITDTNAVPYGFLSKPSYISSGLRVGICIWDYNNNNIARKEEEPTAAAYNSNNGTGFPMWYNLNDELGLILSKGEKYTWQMYVTYNGNGYWSEKQSFITTGDTEKPKISNVKVTDISSTGYTIQCTVTDNVRVERVQFPTWTQSGGQDDIIKDWSTNSKAAGTINGNTVTYRVNTSDHNNEKGLYNTHIYVYDPSGNYMSYGVDDINVQDNILVTGVDIAQSSHSFESQNITVTLTATVTPSNATNKALTWTSSNTNVAVVDQNGKVTAIGDGTCVITAKAKDGSGKSDICKITVSTVKPSKDFPFTDVPVIENNWKYESVKYVYEHEIMNGISGTTFFAPDSQLNRAMFATVLYRMAGSPAVTYADKFTDVKDGQYYSSAILWANQKGIVNGFSDGSYGVNTNITREQIAKMLCEYATKQGYDVKGKASLNDFTDKEMVSGWAIGYMQWAVNAGMISGKPNGDGTFRLDPKGEATRAECAKMLMMFMQKYQ